jgi:hypothetical protein
MTALPQSTPWLLAGAAVRPRRKLAAAWPACVLLPLFMLLTWRSWGTWPDPLIDFGRELYVPWRMSEGDVLYRDLAYFNGPVSPAINALWFWLFGASLHTLVVANLVIAVATTGVLYWLLRQMSSRSAATIACAAFLLLCVFSQFTRIRNYNFICPYSHEMTHGLLLSLLAMAAAWQVERRRFNWPATAGILLGLVLLTKPELAIAAAVGVLASILLLSGARALLVAIVAAAIPPAIAVALLARAMPVGDAVAGCLGAWRMAGLNEIRELTFYRRGLGTLHVGESFALLATSAARWALLLGAAYALMRLSAGKSRRRAVAATFGGAVAVCLFEQGFSWPLMERAFPLALLALACWISCEAKLTQSHSPERRTYALRAVWCLFALAMLVKIALYSRISHYGFVLAVPAIAAILAALFDWAPDYLRRRGWDGDVLPWFAAPLVAAYLLAYQCQQSVLIERTIALGAPPDRFAAPADAAPVARAEQQILHRVEPDQTLAVLPEGVMLNYLTRRAAPTEYITWMPPELYFFGEANMLAALRAAPPDWVLLVPRDFKEYGLPPFGEGYADSIANWIDANYREVEWWFASSDDDSAKWRVFRRAQQ